MSYLGTIVEKDGGICLQTAANVWYPLDGSSGIAEDFRETFNAPLPSDVGKRLYRVNGIIQMENNAQKEAREAIAIEWQRESGQ